MAESKKDNRNVKRDPTPEIFRVEELVYRVRYGDIKLPKFQRLFVWKKEEILRLWDSVYQGYPIGSILLWTTKEKLASEREIGDLEINDAPEEYPTNYLLDGQQRLSSLCGGLYYSGETNNSQWNIYFDLEKEEFFYPENNPIEICHFPINRLLDISSFLNECRKFDSYSNKDKYYENAQKLLNSIKDYKIATIKIGDMSINEVAPIFERINSSGRRLTIVDLMRAATWNEDFDLNSGLENIRESIESKNFDGVSDRDILNNISTCAGFGILKYDRNFSNH